MKQGVESRTKNRRKTSNPVQECSIHQRGKKEYGDAAERYLPLTTAFRHVRHMFALQKVNKTRVIRGSLDQPVGISARPLFTRFVKSNICFKKIGVSPKIFVKKREEYSSFPGLSQTPRVSRLRSCATRRVTFLVLDPLAPKSAIVAESPETSRFDEWIG